ncbi:tetratricopeptide repeat protein [Methanobrevibacter sp.]|uniref:tetratricopeptide repeat protein n=1 Tax=Methanobrevibacter sp. TaxID=66852 RepID=UPI00388F1B23
MDSKIDKGRIEFNHENYEKALNYFDSVSDSDENYAYVVIFKITCLMELERYDKALFLIDSLLEEDPRDEFLLYEKIRCHVALDERQESFKALKKFEKILDYSNKQVVIDVCRFYIALEDYRKALKFCNFALEIDSQFKDALKLKASIAIALDDIQVVDDCANELWSLVDEDDATIISVFLFKIYSGEFRDCLRVIERIKSDLDDEEVGEVLKSLIFNLMSEKLNVQINFTDEVDISIDEALEMLFDYDEKGITYGIVNDTGYVIM